MKMRSSLSYEIARFEAQLISLEPDIDSTLNQHFLATHINPPSFLPLSHKFEPFFFLILILSSNTLRVSPSLPLPMFLALAHWVHFLIRCHNSPHKDLPSLTQVPNSSNHNNNPITSTNTITSKIASVDSGGSHPQKSSHVLTCPKLTVIIHH